MSAGEKVFSITELAEAIFLELSITDLLCRVQKTCRRWKAVIDDSTPLQQALFLKPISHTLASSTLDFYTAPARHRDSAPAAIVEHPLLTRIGSGGTSLARLFSSNPDAVSCPEASWRKSFITQPPVADLRIYVTNEVEADRTIQNPSGILLGELIPDDRAVRTLHASHVYSWVKWRKFWLGCGFYQLKQEVRAVETRG